MRPLKRLLVFTIEVGVLLLGVVLSAVLAAAAAMLWGGGNATGALFLAGLLLTVVGFWAVRRKTRRWKIQYDAVGWALSRAETKIHPTLARRKRIAKRLFVWMPSVIAAAVLFFYPAAFHFLRPSSQNLGPYRVAIPWALAIMPGIGTHGDQIIAFAPLGSHGNFGWMPFWRREPFSSAMIFISGKSYADNSEYRVQYAKEMHAEGTQVVLKGISLGGVGLTCWQYKVSDRWRHSVWAAFTGPLWQVDCE